MHRLLEIVLPHNLYMGQKDYQQCMVVKRLLELTGLDKTVILHISPTLREQSGLAMSSRNMRLSQQQKTAAVAIYRALTMIRENIRPGSLEWLKQKATEQLQENEFRVDYVEISDAATLSPCQEWDGTSRLVALAAAFLGEVRLIDNLLLN